MEFVAFEPGIEVNGQTVWAVVDGFSLDRRVPSRILVEQGIGALGADGIVKLDPSGWYSQEAWLRAFKRIAEALGPNMLFTIGKRIPENAIFPPFVTDIASAISSIDVAYHLNHRKAGEVMFDEGTGAMLEGIGHYGFERPHPTKPLIVARCEDPYPCDFDRGIVTAMARRFEHTSSVVHVDEHACRKHGGNACTYYVRW